ncbi:MAG: aldo/keto reductase [Lachnospiraceae bacterium]|nr:aldo/keto reductase [Lachnospiraceae bacterium]
MMREVTLKNGITLPAIGIGTWRLGEGLNPHVEEVAAVRTGIEAGLKLIDTAEMYGNGGSEKVVGEAIRTYDRGKLYLVSKVLPSNANRSRMAQACENTLRRMGTDYLDLYLYHWRGGTPLAETVACLEDLKEKGRIRAWGVSNFDLYDMEELFEVPNGKNCLVNQDLYHIDSRGIEFDLKPWMEEQHIVLMSYCPLAMGSRLSRGLLNNPVLRKIAEAHDATVAQIILAWNIRNGQTIAIPKSVREKRVIENAKAGEIVLTNEELSMIDAEFPAPTRKMPLDIQ